MAKILISPSKYVQGAGEMAKLYDYAKNYGKKALVLITASGYKRVGGIVEESFAGKDVEVVFDYFNGECCKKEINRLIAVMQEKGCDLIVGIGGGKILDTSKAVAYYCKTPVLICPTIASTDAPCSALSVIYTEEGVFEEYLFLPANPNMVLMDTDIIAGIESNVDTVLVLSGVTSKEDIGNFPYCPRYVVDGVGDLVPGNKN